ncbi:MAG: Radical SAM superfamily protein [bacterium ADurb.Bin243]|nr:MAG: Radical SAM superfamily protein [bacterium ADurb.Bin243]HOD42280.1 radical SAM protein [Candidatus Wallbacteria bacterium]
MPVSKVFNKIDRIALIEPAVRCECLTSDIFAQIRASLPFLAGALSAAGYGCEIYCEELIELQPHIPKIASSFPAAGISLTINTVRRAIEIALSLKKYNPEIIIIFGGSLAGSFAGEVLAAGDYCLNGRAETALPMLLNSLNSGADIGDVPNLIRISEGKIFKNNVPSPAADFKSDYSGVLNFGNFSEKRNILNFYKPPLYSVFSSTGCVNNCRFCVSEKKYIKREPENVISDFKNIILRHKGYLPPRFMLVDDCAFGDMGYLKNLLARLAFLRKKSNFSLMMQFHVHPLLKDPQLPELFNEAGVTTLLMGFESASDVSLSGERKGTTVSENIKAIEICRKHGITPYGYFVAGFDSDSIESVKEIFDFIIRYSLAAQVLPVGVMKNSAAAPKTDGHETLDPYSFGASMKVSHIPQNMQPYRLQEILIEGYDRIYSLKRTALMKTFRETVYNLFFSLCYRKWRPGLQKHLNYLRLLERFSKRS